MNFSNPPETTPRNVTHKTFYSKLIKEEIGYNIYLPQDYAEDDEAYPVSYHLHGWKGCESTNIWAMEPTYQGKRVITVFANATSSDNGYIDGEIPVESVIINELIPHIDGAYRTVPTREGRSVSGFSMGGAGAFYYAVKYLDLFGSVTVYDGTFHHFMEIGKKTPFAPIEETDALYDEMLRGLRHNEQDRILHTIKQNADRIRGGLRIKIHAASDAGLICENEIMHRYLDSLDIPHEYKVFEGVGHDLGKLI